LGTFALLAKSRLNLLPFASPGGAQQAPPFFFFAHYSTCTEEKQDNLSYEFLD
jgi:hypothetical protein